MDLKSLLQRRFDVGMSLADAKVGNVSLLDLIRAEVKDDENEVLDALMAIAKVAIEVAGEPTQFKVNFAQAETIEVVIPKFNADQMARIERLSGFKEVLPDTEYNGNVIGGRAGGYTMVGVMLTGNGNKRLLVHADGNPNQVTWDYGEDAKYIL